MLQHQLDAAEAEIAEAQEDLNYTVITQPDRRRGHARCA